ncbi:hypothetical protein L209DRAFT_755541 [Thermothelomyces heterothallicus CBS 203.75]
MEDQMDQQLIQEARALMTAMGYLKALVDETVSSSPTPAKAISVIERMGHFHLLVGEFERLSTLRSQSINATEESLRASLEDCAAKTADVDRREAEIRDTIASLDARETAMNTREAGLQAREQEVNSQITALTAREGDVATKESDVNARRARLDSQEAKLETRMSDLSGMLAELKERETALRTKDDLLTQHAAALDHREAVIRKREADLDSRENSLEAREAALDVQTVQTERRIAEADARNADLDAAARKLAGERTALEHDRVAIWVARSEAAKDMTSLEARQKMVEQAQLEVVERTMEANSTLTQQMNDLCTMLADCSTEPTESPLGAVVRSNADLAQRIETLEASVHEVRTDVRNLASNSDLAQNVEDLKASVRDMQAGVRDIVGCFAHPQSAVELTRDYEDDSRKRRRTSESVPGESKWRQLVSKVADHMSTFCPEEVNRGNPGLKAIYYELCLVAMKSVYRARWNAFVQSAPADTWHCVNAVLTSDQGPVEQNGPCELHDGSPCVRVMLRRDGAATRTVFSAAPEEGKSESTTHASGN